MLSEMKVVFFCFFPDGSLFSGEKGDFLCIFMLHKRRIDRCEIPLTGRSEDTPVARIERPVHLIMYIRCMDSNFGNRKKPAV